MRRGSQTPGRAASEQLIGDLPDRDPQIGSTGMDDPQRTDNSRDVLMAGFDDWSRADQEQHLTADDLAVMIAEEDCDA